MSKKYETILGISAVGKSIGKKETAFIICTYYYGLGCIVWYRLTKN